MIVKLDNKLTPPMRTLYSIVSLFVVAAFVCAVPSGAQRAPEPDTLTNPFAGDAAAVAAGRQLYQQTCQACHGEAATGDRGPALSTGNFRHGSTDGDLFHNIQTGIPGTQMPAFSALPADNAWRLLPICAASVDRRARRMKQCRAMPPQGKDFLGQGRLRRLPRSQRPRRYCRARFVGPAAGTSMRRICAAPS